MPKLPPSQGKEAIRRMNLSAALTVVHDKGSVSRTQLIADLRLSRSTVAELVGQLSALGLVTEGEPSGKLGVGRPSLVVRPSELVGAFAVNPESDALSVGFVSLAGTIVSVARQRLSSHDPATTVASAAQMIARITSELPPHVRIVGCGAAIPGQVARPEGVVLGAVSLGWGETDFGGALSEATGLAVDLENNARAVMQAEHRVGVAQGYNNVVYVFAGAGGIGGGVIADDRTVSGKAGFAGELGRMTVPGLSGEGFGSLGNVVRRSDLTAALGAGEASDAELDELVRTSTESSFVSLAEQQIRSASYALSNAANMLDPDLIALGGFVGSLYARFPELFAAELSRGVVPSIARTLQVRQAGDIGHMVLLGASDLVFRRLLADPAG